MAYEPGWREFLEGNGWDVCYVSPPVSTLHIALDWDSCMNEQPYMTADVQDTLEYIVNAVYVSLVSMPCSHLLFPAVTRSMMLLEPKCLLWAILKVIGSLDATALSSPCVAGGMAIQAAITYYPSIRKELSNYISLAG